MDKKYISQLYRPSLSENDRSGFICLDKNEPPFSAFDTVKDIITNEDIQSLRIYPDPFELYTKLAVFAKVTIDQLIITHGSEQAIDFVFRIFLNEGDEVVYLRPSFAMFDVFAYQQKAKVKHIDFDTNMKLNINVLLDSISSQTKLFVLANPNNPTGTAYNFNELKKIAEHTKKTNTTFLLDEAYYHFYEINSLHLLDDFDHIIITRTFSKALGIAGARVGYALSNKTNIDLLRKLKPIDEINHLSNIIAKKVIDNGDIILDKNIKQVGKWKQIFKTEPLKSMNYIDTEGNFILLKSSNYQMDKNLLLENKFLPKMDFEQPILQECFRFSIQNDEVMTKLLNLLIKDSKHD